MQDGEPGADDALGVGGARGALGPPLAGVGPDGFILHRRPALAMPVALGALPGAEDEIALHGRCEAARDAVRARRPVPVRAAAQDAARRPWGEALVEVLREQQIGRAHV